METYSLNIESPITGGYFSSEQIDLLSIIQCKKQEEVIDFINKCRQLKGVFGEEKLQSFLNKDLEQLKREVFKAYQDTLVLHDSDKKIVLYNTLSRLGLPEEEEIAIKKIGESRTPETLKYIKEYIKVKHKDDYEKIIKQAHCFISIERDQNKSEKLYDELTLVNNSLGMFNTLLVGSGKPEIIINALLSDDSKSRFDFYFAERDLDFAFRNNKHIRFHSLLTKTACEQLFDGRSKEEILQILTAYVEKTINFVNEYNESHKIQDGTPVINDIDLFNEIVSFDKMIFDKEMKKWLYYKKIDGEYKVVIDDKKKIYRDLKEGEIPEYQNIWYTKYGMSMQELMSCFDYALHNKPAGVSYLYNEPFLENDDRRGKVLETLSEIDDLKPRLIDTLGSQMHITITQDIGAIERCFADFKRLQETTGKKIQTTEFDMSLGKNDIPRVFGPNADVTLEQVYDAKAKKISEISNVINSSGVKLSGVSYWSLTDGIDCNLERLRSNALASNQITDVNQIPTACGGLIPTHKELIKNNELSQMLNDKPKSEEQKQNNTNVKIV